MVRKGYMARYWAEDFDGSRRRRHREGVNARARALTILGRRHPDEYAALYAEQLAKVRKDQQP